MTSFDDVQQQVLALNPARNARVLGAPGTGKTVLLVECFAQLVNQAEWNESEVLALAPNRLVAAHLRNAVETRVNRAMGGVPVRTPSSFAFSVLNRGAASAGRTPPRLLTGTVHDELIAEVVRERLERTTTRDRTAELLLAPEVLSSAQFRAELRELSRVLEDFALEPDELQKQLARDTVNSRSQPISEGPELGLGERWDAGLQLLTEVNERLRSTRPDELSSSSMLRRAAHEISAGEAEAPRLLLVDDAQELGEGALALLAACANAGSNIWVFGDPDVATGAFQGERTRVLAGLAAELTRRGWRAPTHSLVPSNGAGEQVVLLERVYRHGPVIRGLVRELTGRIGAAGVGAQRAAVSAKDIEGAETDVQFVQAASESEQLGIIAHRMRRRKLGPGNQLAWNEMAVVCRSREEAARVSRLLAAHQVPSEVASGGIVLRDHQIVRELIELLRYARGSTELNAAGILKLVGGVIGGLDPVAVRRLRGSLLIHERRAARSEDRATGPIDELVYEAFAFPGTMPVIDSAGGRVLHRLGRIAAAATRVHTAGGTPREVLWAIWDGTRLAKRWQDDALAGRGVRADEANRALDAVLGLFFALQRHEEQDSTIPVEDLLDDLLSSAVPEDTLARRSARAAVTVTTPQGMVGQEFALVTVLGVQDGSWPNLRARGSLLGTSALERMLRGDAAQPPSRRDTIHDELRLFAQACSRASQELLVVAVSDEQHFPSPFFGFGRAYVVEDLPHSRLTLRGVTAQARRNLSTSVMADEPVRGSMAHTLAVLAGARVTGAHPDEWYGVMPVSTNAPLFAEHDGDTPDKIPVSPSQLERAENCPLDWVIGSLGGGTGNLAASLGTLVHHALETVVGTDAEDLLQAILVEWSKLPFDAAWESERMRRTAAEMAEGLSEYLREFAASDRELLGRESRFTIEVERAELRGVADRLERRTTASGTEITVIDLKTGRTPATKNEAEEHVQMQAYQLGVARGAFEMTDAEGRPVSAPLEVQTAAKLLYVHPDATRGKAYVERAQSELDEEVREKLLDRVTAVAEVMAAGEFTARIEHHCADPNKHGNCGLHIIQAVSHA